MDKLVKTNNYSIKHATMLKHFYSKHGTLKHRNSSPKHYTQQQRSHNDSPKMQAYKPNINDLKQLFDDSKRNNTNFERKHPKNYFDANQSMDSEYLNFERVKQKFDNKHSNKTMNNNGHSSAAPSGSRTNNPNCGSNRTKASIADEASYSKNININETIQFFDNDLRSLKNSNHLDDTSLQQGSKEKTGNFNLDGFKVSDEEDDGDDVS